jgi:hypothetical protein
MRRFFALAHRVLVGVNVAVAATIGIWLIWRHLGAPHWLPGLMVIILVPGWAIAAFRGAR